MSYTSLDAHLSSFFAREIWHQHNLIVIIIIVIIIVVLLMLLVSLLFSRSYAVHQKFDIHAHIPA